MENKISYRVFFQDQRARLAAQYPFLKQNQINGKVRDLWNHLPDCQKQNYTKKILKTKTKKRKTGNRKCKDNKHWNLFTECDRTCFTELSDDYGNVSKEAKSSSDCSAQSDVSLEVSSFQNDVNKISVYKTYSAERNINFYKTPEIVEDIQISKQGILKTPKLKYDENRKNSEGKVNFSLPLTGKPNPCSKNSQEETVRSTLSDESDSEYISGDMHYSSSVLMEEGCEKDNTENRSSCLKTMKSPEECTESVKDVYSFPSLNQNCCCNPHGLICDRHDCTGKTPLLHKSKEETILYKTPETNSQALKDNIQQIAKAPKKKRTNKRNESKSKGIQHAFKKSVRTSLLSSKKETASIARCPINPEIKSKENAENIVLEEITNRSTKDHHTSHSPKTNTSNLELNNMNSICHVVDAGGDRCPSHPLLEANYDFYDDLSNPVDVESGHSQSTNKLLKHNLVLEDALKKLKETVDVENVSDLRSPTDSPKLLSPVLSGISEISDDSGQCLLSQEVYDSDANLLKAENIPETEGILCSLFEGVSPKIKKSSQRRLVTSSGKRNTNFTDMFQDNDIFI